MQELQEPIDPLPSARAIFRRAATAMLIIAGVELAISIWNTLQHPGNFTINLGLLIGAAMLWSNNLRAVSLVRWVSAAYLPALALAVFFLIRQPADLTLAYLRLYPFQAFMVVVMELVHWLMALRLVIELGRPAVMAARAAAGKKRRDMRIPFALGVAGVLVGIVFTTMIMKGERVERAAALAQQTAGKDYKVYTESINVVKNLSSGSESGTIVHASVAAWNDRVVMHVPVSWDEP